jgi:hypothetical protein
VAPARVLGVGDSLRPNIRTGHLPTAATGAFVW